MNNTTDTDQKLNDILQDLDQQMERLLQQQAHALDIHDLKLADMVEDLIAEVEKARTRVRDLRAAGMHQIRY